MEKEDEDDGKDEGKDESKDEDEAQPSEEKEKVESELIEVVIIQPLTFDKLWVLPEDFNHDSGEHIATWILWCWNSEASRLDLVEARKLESLLREGALTKGTRALTL